MSASDNVSERTLNGEGRSSIDTVDLYTVLGVDREATPNELKRAYRRLALQHHPDRNPRAAGRSGEFVRIQYAYDVLSDERKRRIYNRYGELGVQMAGRVGGELLDPLVSNMLSIVAFSTAIVALLLIMFFALLSRRVDRASSWPYSVIFMPLWTIDVVILAVLVWSHLKPSVLQDNEDSESVQFEEEEACVESVSDAPQADNMPATDATPLLGARNNQSAPQPPLQQPHYRRRQQRLRTARKHVEACASKLATAAPMLYLLLLVAFQLSLVLKLDEYVDWSIIRIAAPWLGIETIHFVLLTLQLTAGLVRINEHAAGNRSRSTSKMVVLAADTFWWLLIRVSLALLIVGKLSGMLATWSWVLVFVPAYLPAVRWAIALSLLRRQLRAMGSDGEMEQNENAIVMICVIAFSIVMTFMYSFVALLIWKLSQPLAIRLALVLVPVFIALSLACCCCSCLGLCLRYGLDATVENEMAGQPDRPANAAVVPAEYRIASPCI
ncbi:hypothetical protein IWW40_001529 [Coemansia sp. RSA 1250]|nr:hypothetical protein IWW40_001529 [Coemansia sp. RSA 1250]